MQEMPANDNRPPLYHCAADNSSLKINSDRMTCLNKKMCNAYINAKTDNALLSK